jgi:alpha-tubulin suppressor-like RCC1 family protein
MNTYHALGLKPTGVVWAWGNNTTGQLGDQTVVSKSSPILVVGVHTFIKVSNGGGIGNANSAGLKSSGQVWTWGYNNAGQLGDETVTNKSSPVLVVGNHSFIHVVMGEYTCMGLKSNGQVWTWGYNIGGQLGDQTTASKSSPVLVVGGYFFTSVTCGAGGTAGQSHCAALDVNGRAFSWGYNNSGQLGNETTASASSPVLVVGNHSFISIKAGLMFTAALKADGSVWAWGDNTAGQLGNQSVTATSSPVLVVGSHSFIHIYASYRQITGIKTDGSIWCWGNNANGQLGDNTVVSKSSPVLVVGSHSFVQLAMARSAVFGLKANGQIWSWGYNGFGQLGDNTITDKSSPVLVVGSHVFAHLWNQSSYLPIVLDATSNSNGGAVSSLTWAHVIGSGTNRMLFILIAIENTVTRAVSNVTYNGVACTFLDSRWSGATVGSLATIWYMPEASLPVAGSYNIVVTIDAALDRGIVAGGISLNNVEQIEPFSFASNSSTSATYLQKGFDTIKDGDWVIDVISGGNNQSLTADAGQTRQWDVGGGATMRGAASVRQVNRINTVFNGWTIASAATSMAVDMVSVSPYYPPFTDLYVNTGLGSNA